jgi:hypothetical protein
MNAPLVLKRSPYAIEDVLGTRIHPVLTVHIIANWAEILRCEVRATPKGHGPAVPPATFARAEGPSKPSAREDSREISMRKTMNRERI